MDQLALVRTLIRLCEHWELPEEKEQLKEVEKELVLEKFEAESQPKPEGGVH